MNKALLILTLALSLIVAGCTEKPTGTTNISEDATLFILHTVDL